MTPPASISRDTDSRGGSLTDHAVITSTGELLAAVARLSDDELLLLSKLAWRLANDFTEESTRPRVAEVVHRCGVVLAEEHDFDGAVQLLD